ncbi:MAG: hypothetical protein QM640_10480 [Niabella sp.]
MNKTLLLSVCCLLTTGIALHTKASVIDSSYKEYAGKYIFGGDSPVPEVDVYIQDTALFATSEESGAISLKKAGTDSFEVNAAGAISVAFKRDSADRVTEMLVYTMKGDIFPGEKQKPADDPAKGKEMVLNKKENTDE